MSTEIIQENIGQRPQERSGTGRKLQKRSESKRACNSLKSRAIPKKKIIKPLREKYGVDLYLEPYDPSGGFRGYVWNLIRLTDAGFGSVDVKTGYDNINKKITRITFGVGKWGKCTHTMHFIQPVTEEEAVLRVTEWLLKPMTYDYFYKLYKDHDLDIDLTWRHFKGKNRGSALGDSICLTIMKYDNNGGCTIGNGRYAYSISSEEIRVAAPLLASPCWHPLVDTPVRV